MGYPLVNTQNTLEIDHFGWIIGVNDPFSIAKLDYWKVDAGSEYGVLDFSIQMVDKVSRKKWFYHVLPSFGTISGYISMGTSGCIKTIVEGGNQHFRNNISLGVIYPKRMIPSGTTYFGCFWHGPNGEVGGMIHPLGNWQKYIGKHWKIAIWIYYNG